MDKAQEQGTQSSSRSTNKNESRQTSENSFPRCNPLIPNYSSRKSALRPFHSFKHSSSSHPISRVDSHIELAAFSSSTPSRFYTDNNSYRHHIAYRQYDNDDVPRSNKPTSSYPYSRGRREIMYHVDKQQQMMDCDSDGESVASTKSCISTPPNRGIIFPVNLSNFGGRRPRHVSSRSNQYNHGIRFPVNNDNKHLTRRARVGNRVKFVLSSSRKKFDNNFDDLTENNTYKVTYIGYKYIEALKEKKPHDIVCEIVKSDSPFASFLNEAELEADWLMLVVEILRNMCSSSFTGNINEMLNRVLRSQLMHAITYYLNDIETESKEETIAKMKTFMENLTELLSSITNTLPLIAVERDVKKVIGKTIKAIEKVNTEFKAEVEEKYTVKLETLILKIDNYKEMWSRKVTSASSSSGQRSYEDKLSEMSPPDDFRTISLQPTYEDLKGNKFTFIRPNKVKGAYENVEHYLDVQFRLLREDFVYPLRIGLREYMEAKTTARNKLKKMKFKYESVRFYPDTKFEDRCLTKSHEVGYTLVFDPKHRMKKIKWENSKRFMYGSLLLFTTNDFETFFYGTVLERNEKLLQAGSILIKLPLSVEITETFFQREYLLAESDVFFEPYFHVMRRLQTFKQEEFPMPKIIVSGQIETERPLYLKKLQELTVEELKKANGPAKTTNNYIQRINEMRRIALGINLGVGQDGHDDDTLLAEAKSWDVLGHSVNLTKDDQWPAASKLALDESQYEAFKTALTSNFCVIQGPPGTGKTFIGLKIMQVLLSNMKKCNIVRIKPPILIVCYTNHALDQFLEGIVPFTSKIVRAGSRSNSEILKNFQLRGRNQMRIRNEARNVHNAMSSVIKEVENLYQEIQRLTEIRDKIEKPCGILKYELIESVMNDYQKQNLPCEDQMKNWLLPIYEKFNSLEERITFRYEKRASVEEENQTAGISNEDCDLEDDGLVDELLNFEVLHIRSPYCVQYSDFENIQQNYENEYSKIENLMKTAGADHRMLNKLMNEQRELYFSFKRKVREYYMLREQLENPRVNVEQSEQISRKNMHYLSVEERWLLYWSWVAKVRENMVAKLNATEKHYASKLERLSEYKQIEDVYVVERADVVGMTTTCAARLHHVLETVKPAVVIIEEAAEVLESHIVASLTDACEQVILIGDHKQLKPSTAVYHLCKTYNFDISLFERMINNGMHCPMLRVQHRMRPEISKLITPLIYPNLKDHESVLKFERVRGVCKSVFFLEHNEFEEEVEDSSSRRNHFEAEFVLKLCEYLVHQGYSTSNITILTTYSGQMFLIREKKRQQYPALADVKCIVVDKYQGEENEIILLSLVRSNAEARIGFLKTENRVCVALSRAKKGFYMIGNMDNLRASSPFWEKIQNILQADGAIGPEMQLYCKKHALRTNISKLDDFSKVVQGGCGTPCAELLECGHHCRSVCHTMEHSMIKCLEPCARTCIRSHPCQQFCYEPCNRCMVVELRVLPCGHEEILACYIDENTYKCEVIVDDHSPVCGHPIKRKCGENAEHTKCSVKCGARLDCGHACPRTCHKNNDPDHLDFNCRRKCERLNEKCTKSHQCLKQCFEECGLCTVVEKMTLPCGHEESIPCFTDLKEFKCFQRCTKSCPDCNAKCKKLCSEQCAPCLNLVEKTIPECGHQISVQCCQEAKREHCSRPCESLAPCGHKCKAICSKPCKLEKCRELVKTDQIQALCGHNDFVRIFCFEQNEVGSIDKERLLQHCRAPCDTKLKCGDLCVGTCGLCWQGRMHKNCQEDCKNVLICGHTCKVKCREICPPCNETCSFKCEHSSCTKKCGVPCTHCMEPCRWRCKHSKCARKCGQKCNRKPCYEACEKKLPCQHPCIGYCGEPCPTQCRICNPEITEIMFGWEDEPNARFVKLNDCGHVIESRALDTHLQMSTEYREIVVKACPMCKTPIVTTLRYKNIVRETYMHIINIKRKIFGDLSTLMTDGNRLLQNFEALRMEYVSVIRVARLWNVDKIIYKYVDFLSIRIRPKHQRHQTYSISATEMTALNFFYGAFHTILSCLINLTEEQIVSGTVQHTWQRSPPNRYNKNSYKKVLKLDTSVFATKTIALVQRLVEKMDGFFLRVSQQLCEDISLEIERYTKMVDYCSALRKYAAYKDLEEVKAVRVKIEAILFGLTRFVPEQRKAVDSLFQELTKILKSDRSLTTEEKRMIHLAMSKDFHGGSQSKGHWFTCTRGHYYCITECGGATQESNCPECGEKIGGQNHRYVDTIRVAQDMDGATRPAWPLGHDMRNYGGIF